MAWNITVSSQQSLLETSRQYFLLFFLHWNIVTQSLIYLHSYVHLLRQLLHVFVRVNACLCTNYSWLLPQEHSRLTISKQHNNMSCWPNTVLLRWCEKLVLRVKTLRLCDPKVTAETVGIKVEMMQQRNKHSNCTESSSVHHVNKFAQQHLEHHIM